MLAAVETELFNRGDSVDLPIEPVLQALEAEPDAPASRRGMGPTLLNLARRHGLYAEVFSPDDYISLCTTSKHPYGQQVVLDVPDNWEGNRFLNLSPDSLLRIVEKAIRNHRGVCWEGDISEKGFSFEKGVAELTLVNGHTTDDHCMDIVGIVSDQRGRRYFVMKNSWGCYNPYGGLMLMSFGYFKKKTVAVVLPKDLLPNAL